MQLNEKNKVFNKLNLLIIVAFIGIFYFVSNNQLLNFVFSATFDRITDQTVDIDGFDRFRESNSYLYDQTNFFDIVIGRGFAGQHQGYNGAAISLHTGWANFILKGGVLFLILVITPVLKSFRLLFNFKTLPNHLKFSVLYILIQALRLSYTNMHNYRPELLILFCCVFVVMDYKIRVNRTV